MLNPSPDARILSLVPSLTELAFDLGLGHQIVGRTAYCLHPSTAVETVPSVGGTKKVNWAKVEASGATHALLNIDENPKDMAEGLAERGITPVVSHPINVTDNRRLFQLMGDLFGREREAAQLLDTFNRAYRDLSAVNSELNVLYLIWQDPWMTISPDTYIARMLNLIGWQHLDFQGARYPELDLTDELLTKVDRLLFSTEPFAFTETHVSAFRAAFPKHAHKAQLVDGELLSWYGSRAIKGLRYLNEFAR